MSEPATAATLVDLRDDDERAPTIPYIAPVFFGQRVGPFPADQPLPAHVVVGSTDATRDERTPASRHT